MRNAITGWMVLLALLCSGRLAAQHEQALAQALKQEEVEGRVEEALASYRAVVAASKAKDAAWAEAQLGVARCLRRLARWEEAVAVLAELEGAESGAARANAIREEKERLERARGEQDEERKRLLRDLELLLGMIDWNQIRSFGPKATPLLLEIARGALPEMIRARALQGLFHQSDPAAVTGVLELVRLGQLPPLSAHGISIPDLRAQTQDWDPVIRAFLQYADASVRLVAVKGLRSLRAPAPDLVRRALVDPEISIRRELLEWTAELSPWVDDELLAEILVGFARDPQVEIRQRWTPMIERFARRCPDAANAACEILSADEVESVRLSAYGVWLQVSPKAQRRSILERALGDAQPFIRINVAERASPLLIPEDAPKLLPYLRFPDRSMRANAARLLWGIGHASLADRAENVELLLEALSDSEAWVRYLAGKSLLAVARREDAPRLARLLQDGAGDVRIDALDTFIRQDAIEVFPTILEVLPSLSSMPVVGTVPGSSAVRMTSRNFELLRWLVVGGHRRELDQVLERIEEIELEKRIVELLQSALDADQKRALWSRLANLEDRARATKILRELRTLGRGDAEFVSTCAQLLGQESDARRRARLALLLCESGSAEHFELILDCAGTSEFKELGPELVPAGRYFARHTDEARRPRLESVLRATSSFNLSARASQVLEGASFSYLLALAHSDKASGYGMPEVLEAIGRNQEPDGVQVLLELLRASSDEDVSFLGGILARGSSAESPQMRIAPHLLAIHRVRPERFLEIAQQILGSRDSQDYALESAVALCALLPGGAGDALLLRCLDDERSGVRKVAVRAVAHLLLEASIPRLKELLRDAAVSDEANQALLRFAAFGYPIR